MGPVTVKLCIPTHLLGLIKRKDRQLTRVRPLHLIDDERYGGGFRLIAVCVRRLSLHNVWYSVGSQHSLLKYCNHMTDHKLWDE